MPSRLQEAIAYVVDEHFPDADTDGLEDAWNPVHACFRKLVAVDERIDGGTDASDDVRSMMVVACINAVLASQPSGTHTPTTGGQKRVNFAPDVVSPGPRRHKYKKRARAVVASQLVTTRTVQAGSETISLTWGAHPESASVNWAVAMAELQWHAQHLPGEVMEWQADVDDSDNWIMAYNWINLCFMFQCLEKAWSRSFVGHCKVARSASTAFAKEVASDHSLPKNLAQWTQHARELATQFHAKGDDKRKNKLANDTLPRAIGNVTGVACLVADWAEVLTQILNHMRQLLKVGRFRSFGITLDKVEVLIKGLRLVERHARLFCDKEERRLQKLKLALPLPPSVNTVADHNAWFSAWQHRAKATKTAYVEYHNVMQAMVRVHHTQQGWKTASSVTAENCVAGTLPVRESRATKLSR